jgi:hypothetical protein
MEFISVPTESFADSVSVVHMSLTSNTGFELKGKTHHSRPTETSIDSGASRVSSHPPQVHLASLIARNGGSLQVHAILATTRRRCTPPRRALVPCLNQHPIICHDTSHRRKFLNRITTTRSSLATCMRVSSSARWPDVQNCYMWWIREKGETIGEWGMGNGLSTLCLARPNGCSFWIQRNPKFSNHLTCIICIPSVSRKLYETYLSLNISTH